MFLRSASAKYLSVSGNICLFHSFIQQLLVLYPDGEDVKAKRKTLKNRVLWNRIDVPLNETVI